MGIILVILWVVLLLWPSIYLIMGVYKEDLGVALKALAYWLALGKVLKALGWALLALVELVVSGVHEEKATS